MILKEFIFTKDLSVNANLILNCCYNWRYKKINNYILEKATGLSKATIIRMKKELLQKQYIWQNWTCTEKMTELKDYYYNNNKKDDLKQKMTPLQLNFNKVFDKIKNKSKI